MDIQLPSQMTLQGALDFCKYLDNLNLESADIIILKMAEFRTCDPFGMLIVGSKVREMKKKYSNKTLQYYPVDHPHSYAGHMGFYQSIGLPYGKEPGEAPGSSTYVPISKLPVADIKRAAIISRRPVGEILEGYAFELARILKAGNDECIEHMAFAIREIMRNVVEHSQSETLWYAGQVWPYYKLVEIAVIDEGVGIHTTINSNRYYKDYNHDNLSALRFALQPGITQTFSPQRRQSEEDDWKNTGFGLYMTSKICERIGNFVICSDQHALQISKGEEEESDAPISGTAIRMRLRIPELKSVTALRRQLIKEGEVQARQNSKMAVINASRASKLGSMLKR